MSTEKDTSQKRRRKKQQQTVHAISVVVNSSNGSRTLKLRAKESTTIKSLKQEVFIHEGIPVSDQKICVGDKVGCAALLCKRYRRRISARLTRPACYAVASAFFHLFFCRCFEIRGRSVSVDSTLR
mmetsp:Transcript_14946/g.37920  ORF Transcript_14946/g.37920 Transcript_14946/m.37920 type:complete len:126 (+) Transcript_14946:112-489(+)